MIFLARISYFIDAKLAFTIHFFIRTFCNIFKIFKNIKFIHNFLSSLAAFLHNSGVNSSSYSPNSSLYRHSPNRSAGGGKYNIISFNIMY